MEQIKTFEDACQVEGLTHDSIPDFSCYPQKDHAAMIAHSKLVIIARAANRLANDGKEWVPDWNNYSQYKYYPYFELGGPSGFRFVGCDCWNSGSNFGSRLCFISREVATQVGKQFIDLYKEYFTL